MFHPRVTEMKDKPNLLIIQPLFSAPMWWKVSCWARSLQVSCEAELCHWRFLGITVRTARAEPRRSSWHASSIFCGKQSLLDVFSFAIILINQIPLLKLKMWLSCFIIKLHEVPKKAANCASLLLLANNTIKSLSLWHSILTDNCVASRASSINKC